MCVGFPTDKALVDILLGTCGSCGFAARKMVAMSELREGVKLPVPEVRGGQTAPARHVLVVENESLVALLMGEQLAELGYTVIGPAFTMPEVRRLASLASIDVHNRKSTRQNGPRLPKALSQRVKITVTRY